MIQRIVTSDIAKADVVEASLWYDDHQQGLGDQFLAELQDTIDQIVATPEIYPIIDEPVRRAFTKRFPFAIYYSIEGETLTIVGVVHAKRSPDHWRRHG